MQRVFAVWISFGVLPCALFSLPIGLLCEYLELSLCYLHIQFRLCLTALCAFVLLESKLLA